MNKQTEALKIAIEALDDIELCDYQTQQKALKACKEALEQPEQEYLTRAQQVIRANNSAQEPVAWMHRHEGEITEFNDFQSCDKCEPLYTHHAPSWQGLSDDEIANLIKNKLLNKEQITTEDLLDLLLEQQDILERKNK